MSTPVVRGAQSRDLAEMLRLLHAGFRIQSIKVQFSGDLARALPCAIVELTKGAFSRELQSCERDFTDYCFSLHHSLDANGEVVFRGFRDQNRYWEEQKALCYKVEEKRKVVGDRYRNGQLHSLGYDAKRLLIDCLKSREWGASRFLPLKRDHIELGLAVLIETQNVLAGQRRLYDSRPEAKAYGALIEQILNAAWQKEDTFMRRCVRFLDYATLDIDDAILRAYGQVKHVNDLFQLLAPRTPISARHGLPHLLDGYRRYCEALKPFVRALGQAVQVAGGKPPLPDNMRYQKIVDTIRSSRFGTALDCLDPAIRNAESHAGTEYDDERGLVLLTGPDPDGGRRILGSYTYQQAGDMTLRLERGLFPAVLCEFAVHQVGLLATVMHSPEYTHLLLSIDNLVE